MNSDLIVIQLMSEPCSLFQGQNVTYFANGESHQYLGTGTSAREDPDRRELLLDRQREDVSEVALVRDS